MTKDSELVSIVLSLALLDADGKPEGERRIEVLSNKIAKVKSELNIPISVRKIPEGYYSEDVDRMISGLLLIGAAEKRSPFSLTEKGRKLIRKKIKEFLETKKEDTERIAKILGVDVSEDLIYNA